MTELLLDWLDPFITRVERGRFMAWHLGVSLYPAGGENLPRDPPNGGGDFLWARGW